MIKEKRDYIKNQIGFHFDDLSHKRQLELAALNFPSDFVYVALGRKPLSYWEANGFGLLFRNDFTNEVNNILAAIEAEDDEKFIEREQPKVSNTFKAKHQTIDAKTLSSYPDEAFYWVDDNNVISNITNTEFEVIGGKEWYETYIELYGRKIAFRKTSAGWERTRW